MAEHSVVTERDYESRSFLMVLRRETGWILFGSFVTLILTIFIFQLWNLNPRIPALYSGDGLLTLNGLRNMNLGNWYWSTDKLGAPFGQDLRDFPAIADNLHLAILWLAIRAFRDEFLVFNGFFFATYLFAFVGGFAGSRMLRISQPISVFIGVSYAFLPYHFQHGPGHLYLAAYWPVPIWFAFLARQLIPNLQSLGPVSLNLKTILQWCFSSTGLWITALAIMSATTGLYYACFFLVLSLVVILISTFDREPTRRLFPTIWAGLVSILTLGLQFLPIWLFQQENGNNLSIVKRSVAALEFYSLKISNMVLPVSGHRIQFLASLRERSNATYLIGEGTEALGFLGAIGILSIILLAIYGLKKKLQPLNQSLTLLSLASLIIAATGGLSFLVGIAGFTQVRVWSRISIVIAFPAIIISALFLEHLLKKRTRPVFYISLGIILSLVILDTNPGNQLPSYDKTAAAWNRDKDLVHFIELTAGKNSRIFQLPQIPFPENPPVVNLGDYELLRGYMHSSTLSWSYGAVKGRNRPDIQDSLVSEDLLVKLKNDDFTVVWLEKGGFQDSGVEVSKNLSALGLEVLRETPDVTLFRVPKD